MKWTKEKPQKPGWYWYRNPLETSEEIVEVYYDGPDNQLVMKSVGWIAHELISSIQDNHKWAGPIEEPED